MPRRFIRAIRAAQIAGAAVAIVVLAILFLPRGSGGGDPARADVEQPDVTVAVVPAADSAGFFVALHQGLFTAQGLHVTFKPAVSSATVINAQAADQPSDRVDISCGNYVSYLQAQENYDEGDRSSAANDSMVSANLDIFAEGSVMGPNAQGLYVLPGSRIRSLDDLRGQTIGVNAPGNILYLLTASVLADHGLRASQAHFAYYPLPEMASACWPTWTRGLPPRSRCRAARLPASGRRSTRRRWPPSGPRSSRASRSPTPAGPPWSRRWRRCPSRSRSPR
jgi:ABC-type nitrate/sulfonate/bicarbonate transport system substrate-binding protein